MLQLDLLKFRQYLRSLLGGHCVQREGVVLLLCFASHFRLTVNCASYFILQCRLVPMHCTNL